MERLTRYVVTAHAARQMVRRGIDRDVLDAVLSDPEQRRPIRGGREVFQRKMTTGPSATIYLVRVIVDVDRDPPEVVTAYRTSRIDRYEGGPA